MACASGYQYWGFGKGLNLISEKCELTRSRATNKKMQTTMSGVRMNFHCRTLADSFQLSLQQWNTDLGIWVLKLIIG
jgi:hypothetical protein